MRITGQGIWGPPRDESEAIALLRRVVDRGVTFIDTADSYGPGVSEMLIARRSIQQGWWWPRRTKRSSRTGVRNAVYQLAALTIGTRLAVADA